MQDNNTSNGSRAMFATKIGAIAATVGSAVGLGNIWRFPYEAGVHGGGAFMICYMVFLFLICVPVLIAEFFIGRATRSNIFGAYRSVAPGKKLYFAGYIGIVASLLILSFYSVVAGWTIEYCISSITGALDFSNPKVGHDQFLALTTGWRPIIWTVIFLFFNTFILFGGVTKGIERASNILMPILFLLLIAFCINSFTLPGFQKGVKFLFHPDFSKINSTVLLGALGQAFFSLSLGLGGMMTYASYFNNDTRLGQTAMVTAVLDAGVAILSSIIIFPAVFSFGMSPAAGPTLVFEVLPRIFTQLPGGAIWSTLFFLLLFLASLTSTVSMSEISISFLCEEKKISRKKATIISSLISLAGGTLCALSFGPLSDFTVCGLTIFNLFDYVSSNILLPVGGFICSIVAGWWLDKKFVRDQMTDYGKHKFAYMGILIFCLRWLCPIAIFFIFLNTLGVI